MSTARIKQLRRVCRHELGQRGNSRPRALRAGAREAGGYRPRHPPRRPPVYGSFGLPRVAIAYVLPRSGVKFRGGYGRAFTAPSLTDLYYPGYNNTDLKPERSTTWEAGASGSWLSDRVGAGVGWHHTDYTDLIEGVLQPNFTFVPENVGEARRGRGIHPPVTPSARFGHHGKRPPDREPTRSRARRFPRPAWRFRSRVVARRPRPHAPGRGAGWTRPRSVQLHRRRRRVLDGDNPGYAVLDLVPSRGSRAGRR